MNHPEYNSCPTDEELAKAEAMAITWYGLTCRYYSNLFSIINTKPVQWEDLEKVSRDDLINMFVYFNREVESGKPCDGVASVFAGVGSGDSVDADAQL